MKRTVNTDNKEIELTRTYSQGQELKPRGLWYAIDNEWIEWCEGNTDGWIKNGIIELEIDISKMLIVETAEQLREFFDKFNYEVCKGIRYIDWGKIAQNYSGLEIRNYHNLKCGNAIPMMDSTWFWAWDVSSGCVWDLSIIKSFSHCALEKTEKENCG
jgi:hypothetical protein